MLWRVSGTAQEPPGARLRVCQVLATCVPGSVQVRVWQGACRYVCGRERVGTCVAGSGGTRPSRSGYGGVCAWLLRRTLERVFCAECVLCAVCACVLV